MLCDCPLLQYGRPFPFVRRSLSFPNTSKFIGANVCLKSSAAHHAVRIRIENTHSVEERAIIRRVNAAAFGGSDEADLVDKLRGDEHALISLVAEFEGNIVGYTMFSRMWINTSPKLVSAVALAPVAVLPEHQRKGIGGLLIQHGLELLRIRGERIVIVVGHPAYYPRFGFSADKAKLLESPFRSEAFMAMELSPGALDGIQGSVVYPPAFRI
jgi:putative acetyltransferase